MRTEKTIHFGKIDGYKNGRMQCALDVELALDGLDEGRPVFTASATLWNARHTDALMGGQCIDTLATEHPGLARNKTYAAIMRLWKAHHLNGMHAGTERQEEALRKVGLTGWASRYDDCCEYLKGIGLYEDGGYRFGSGWLYKGIPESDLNEIKSLMGIA